MTTPKHEAARRALHLAALCAFAVAQPLYALLEANPAFFSARRAGRLEIFALVAVASVLLPALAAAAGALLGRARLAQAAMVGLLCLAAIYPPAKHALGSGHAATATAAALAALLATLYARFDAARSFASLLALGLVAFPVAFLASRNVRPIWIEGHVELATARGNGAPAVVLLFDELPLSSLLDAKGEVDAVRYPGFGKLAKVATWYRNATSTAAFTEMAVPAMLTGRLPGPTPVLANALEYPQNLFTLLGGSYSVTAHESVTQLCPPSVCAPPPPPPVAVRLRLLFSDAAIVWLHASLPARLARCLPSLDGRWMGFGQEGSVSPLASAGGGLEGGDVVRSDAAGDASRFVQAFRPGVSRSLQFLHVLLPHAPWRYLPTGQVYAPTFEALGVIPRILPDGSEINLWPDDPQVPRAAYQRHLLQLGLADRVVSEVLERIEAVGALERTLLVVAADHGVSFRPGQPRRWPAPAVMGDIAPIPLFVKYPGQTVGAMSAVAAEGVDVLPTIADALGISAKGPLDGTSLRTTPFPDRPSRRIFVGAGKALPIASPTAALAGSVQWKASLFRDGPLERVFQSGPLGDVVLRPTASFPDTGDSVAVVHQGQGGLLAETRRTDPVLPLLLPGWIDPPRALDVAVALNGVVAAAGRTRADGHFTFFLPWTLLRDGGNALSFYEVTGVPGSRGLSDLRVAGERYAVHGGTITADDGRRWRMAPEEVRGWLDVFERRPSSLAFAGWAVDVVARRPADEIVMMVNGHSLHVAVPTVARPDVAESLGIAGLPPAGFTLDVPRTEEAEVDSAKVRFYALSRRGVASELNDTGLAPADRDALRLTLRERIAALAEVPREEPVCRLERDRLACEDGSTWFVARDAPGGWVDAAQEVDGSFHLAGWAGDTVAEAPAAAIVAVDDSGWVGSAYPAGDRPDVAAVHGPALLHSAFTLDLPDLLGRCGCVRLFTLGEGGVARAIADPTGVTAPLPGH